MQQTTIQLNDITSEIQRHEQTISNSFLSIGRLLFEVKESKLYLQGYKTFESYIESCFSFSDRHGRRLISVYHLVENLGADNVVHFGLGKLIELLKIPEQEREDFVKNNKDSLEASSVSEVRDMVKPTDYIKPFTCFQKRLQAISARNIAGMDSDAKNRFKAVIGEIKQKITEIEASMF